MSSSMAIQAGQNHHGRYRGYSRCRVRFSCAVTGLEQKADSVTVLFNNEDSKPEAITTPWIVGCDGFSSVVRETADIEFVGFTYPERFVKIGTDFDFEAAGQASHTQLLSDPTSGATYLRLTAGPPVSGEPYSLPASAN